MSKYLRSQHKPQSEDRKSNRQLADLKRENHHLKKQVARLQKEVVRLVERSNNTSALAEDFVAPLGKGELPVNLPTCPKCHTTKIVEFKMPHGTLTVCKECGYKGKNASTSV